MLEAILKEKKMSMYFAFAHISGNVSAKFRAAKYKLFSNAFSQSLIIFSTIYFLSLGFPSFI